MKEHEEEAKKRREADSRTKTQLQAKISDCWKRLPQTRQKVLELEEERERRLLLKEAKEELWKRWRQRKGRKATNPEAGKKDVAKMEERLARIEKELIEEKRKRDREKEEKIVKMERIEKKRRKEKHWEMLRWLVAFLEENREGWDELRRRRVKEEEEKKRKRRRRRKARRKGEGENKHT